MQLLVLIDALNEMFVNKCRAKKSGAFTPHFNYLEKHRLMENSNFAQKRGCVSFLSVALLQYISAPKDNCGFGLQILTKTLLDVSEHPLYLSDFNRNRNM
jgi:hypothetical protein